MNNLFIYSNIDNLDASFVAIRKNASTSIAAALYKNKYDINYDSPEFPKDLNKTDIFSYTDELSILNSYKFVCMRNPFEKLVSGFIHKIVQHPDVEGKAYFEYNSEYVKHLDDIPKSFDMFLSFLEQSDINSVDIHFVPQYQSGRFNSISYNSILKVETLYKDWKNMQKNLNVPDLPNHKIHQSESETYLELIKDKFYNRVKTLYEADFDMYMK